MKDGKFQCNDKTEFSKILENLNKIVGFDFDHAENFDTLVDTYENIFRDSAEEIVIENNNATHEVENPKNVSQLCKTKKHPVVMLKRLENSDYTIEKSIQSTDVENDTEMSENSVPKKRLKINEKLVKSDFLKHQSEYDLRKISVKLQRLKYFPRIGCMIPSIGACQNLQSKGDMNLNQNQSQRSVRNKGLLKRSLDQNPEIQRLRRAKKRSRRKKCPGCLASKCGTCRNCLNPHFKQSCINRICQFKKIAMIKN